MTKVQARLGKTHYELEETPTPGVVKITRFNSDGEREFFVPTVLIINYILEKMGNRFIQAVRLAFGV
jgi:hypothetical protein